MAKRERIEAAFKFARQAKRKFSLIPARAIDLNDWFGFSNAVYGNPKKERLVTFEKPCGSVGCVGGWLQRIYGASTTTLKKRLGISLTGYTNIFHGRSAFTVSHRKEALARFDEQIKRLRSLLPRRRVAA